MKITKALIIRSTFSPDKIYLYTDLPDAIDIENKLDLKFTATIDTGEKYLKEYFPTVPIEVLDLRKPRLKYPKK